MEFRKLGGSVFKVPVLSLGTGGRREQAIISTNYPYWHQPTR